MLKPLDWPRIRAARAWRREVYYVGDIVNWLSLFRTSIKIFKKSRMQLLSCWRVGWKGHNLLDSIFSDNELFVEWGINWVGQSSVGIKLCTHVRLWNSRRRDQSLLHLHTPDQSEMEDVNETDGSSTLTLHRGWSRDPATKASLPFIARAQHLIKGGRLNTSSKEVVLESMASTPPLVKTRVAL